MSSQVGKQCDTKQLDVEGFDLVDGGLCSFDLIKGDFKGVDKEVGVTLFVLDYKGLGLVLFGGLVLVLGGALLEERVELWQGNCERSGSCRR